MLCEIAREKCNIKIKIIEINPKNKFYHDRWNRIQYLWSVRCPVKHAVKSSKLDNVINVRNLKTYGVKHNKRSGPKHGEVCKHCTSQLRRVRLSGPYSGWIRFKQLDIDKCGNQIKCVTIYYIICNNTFCDVYYYKTVFWKNFAHNCARNHAFKT